LIETNYGKNQLVMSPEVGEMTNKLREYMFDNVYLNRKAKTEDEKAEYIIQVLYEYYLKNFQKLPKAHLEIYKNLDLLHEKEDIICDYIAGMTDRYIVNLYMDLFVPKPYGGNFK